MISDRLSYFTLFTWQQHSVIPNTCQICILAVHSVLTFFRVPQVFPVGRYIAVAPLFIIVILWTSYFKHILSDLLVKQAAKSRHEAGGLNCISTSFIRQLENINCMYCSSVANNFWEIWCLSIKSFSFSFNKGYFAIIGLSQRTAPPCFFL